MSDTKLFTVYYRDGTYLSYDFTKDDYNAVKDAMLRQLPAVEVSIGILAIPDIRSVIEQRVKADVPQHEGANPDLPPEVLEWMKAAKLAERLMDEPKDDEFEGGTIL